MKLPGEFAEACRIINPGQPVAVETTGDFWQGSAGEFDPEGTLQATWSGLFPPDTLIKPLAEVYVIDRDLWLWVAGLPTDMRDLLDGTIDHVEAPLKTTFRQLLVVDVLRDTDATDFNELDDPVETGPAVEAVDMAITEISQRVPTSDGDLRVVHVSVGWTAATVDVRRGDRIRVPTGEGAGRTYYSVEQVTQPITTGLLDKRLDLNRTSS